MKMISANASMLPNWGAIGLKLSAVWPTARLSKTGVPPDPDYRVVDWSPEFGDASVS